jgi:hemoglobin/transferrin/lactoferrin receptor protein
MSKMVGFGAAAMALAVASAAQAQWISPERKAEREAEQMAQAPAAQPQQAQAPVIQLDPVQSVADRTAKRTSAAAGNVSVVEKEEMERRQLQDIGGALRDLPSVDFPGGPRPNAGQPMIRGLEGDRVLIRVDGARENFNAGHRGRVFIDPDVLKRIEVVRGPNSVLYGSGAIGGVISMTTMDARDFLSPGETMGAKVKTGFQTVNNQFMSALTTAAMFGPIDIITHFTYRNSGDYDVGGNRGHVPNSGGEPAQALVKMSGDVATGHRLSASALIFRDNDTSTSTPNTAATNIPVARLTNQSTYTLNYAFAPPDTPWVDGRVTAYRTDSRVRENRRNAAPRNDITNWETLGFDLQNTSRANLGVPVAFTYGGEFITEAVSGERNGGARPEFPDAKGRTGGGFVQAAIKALPWVTLTPAMRFDWYYRSPDNPAVGPDLDEGKFSPSVSLAVEPAKWLNVYALYSQAFRAPSMEQLYVTGVHFPGNVFLANPNLKPEQAFNKEVGVKLKFDDVFQGGDQAVARLTVFRTDYNDFIEQIVGPVTTQSVNVNKAYVQGVEFESGYQSGNWFGALNFSILKGEDKATGAPLSSIPAHKLTTTIGYQLPEWDSFFGVRAHMAADQRRSGAAPTTDDYEIFDLFAGWAPADGAFKGARVDVGVDNVFNKLYREHNSANFNPGRNFKITGSYRF